MFLETMSGDYGRTHATDATDATFSARVPKIAEPTGDGVIDCGWGGSKTCNGLILIPIGTGANNAVLTGIRVIGWRRFPGNGTTTRDLWIPTILGEFAAVFGNIPGIAGSSLGASYFFMDTITLVGTSGNANVSNELLSPANDTMASIRIDIYGSQKVEIEVDLGASATAFNCLFAKI